MGVAAWLDDTLTRYQPTRSKGFGVGLSSATWRTATIQVPDLLKVRQAGAGPAHTLQDRCEANGEMGRATTECAWATLQWSPHVKKLAKSMALHRTLPAPLTSWLVGLLMWIACAYLWERVDYGEWEAHNGSV